MRIIHLSDIHFWRYALHPMRLLSKRLVGTASLLMGRGRRFRLERVPDLVERVRSLNPDHVLITGDLTTTALADEFHHARTALSGLLDNPASVTIIPGNHDRYTLRAHRTRRFERYFGAFAPEGPYPWLRPLDSRTAVLGLDPTRAGVSARGWLPERQLIAAAELVAAAAEGAAERMNLLIACHYPVAAPAEYESRLARQVDCERIGPGCLAENDWPSSVLLRAHPRSMGIPPPVDPEPALLEPGHSADA